MLDFLEKIKQFNKKKAQTIEDEKTARKKRLKKNSLHFLIIFLLMFVLLYLTQYVNIGASNIANILSKNQKLESLYNDSIKENDKDIFEQTSSEQILPEQNNSETNEDSDNTTSLPNNIRKDIDMFCRVNEIFNKTILILNTENKTNIFVKMYGVQEFDSEEILPSHFEYMNSLLNTEVGLIFVNNVSIDDVLSGNEIAEAYIVLSNGELLNSKLVRSGYLLINDDGINNKYTDSFLADLEYAKNNNLGYWNK